MGAVRIKFSLRQKEKPEWEPKSPSSDRYQIAMWFWSGVSEHTEPWLKFSVNKDEPDSFRTVQYAEWKLRTVFASTLTDKLREFFIKYGAGANAGVVVCRVEKIEYGTLELFIQILGLDIVTKVLSGGASLLLSAINAYAVESFGLTFPGGERAIVASTEAGPDLAADFQRNELRHPHPREPQQQLSSPENLMDLMRRQWAGAALVLPALLCFLVLLGFGFYLMHIADTRLAQEKEIVRGLFDTTISENRAARAQADARTERVEATLGRLLDSLIEKKGSAAGSDGPTGSKNN